MGTAGAVPPSHGAVANVSLRREEVKTARLDGQTGGVDMYLIRGETKALMVDLGNNYIDGYPPDRRAPRANAAEEFRAVVYGLVGKLPLEAAINDTHPDHGRYGHRESND